MKFFNQIFLYLVLGCFSALSTGCVMNNYEDEAAQVIDNEHAVVVLHLSPLENFSDYYLTDGEIPINEKIETLRIIIIDQQSGIEQNSLIKLADFNKGPDNDCLHYLFYHTTPGHKKFYLFANERSVPVIEGVGTAGLEDYLSGITKNTKVSDFETTINSAWFRPDYKVKNNEITLPYSSYYELDMKEGMRYEQSMYLVPVATKINLNFYNYRSYPVDVQQASISQIADRTFLIGQVDRKEQYKSIGNTGYYWVDWLAKISEMSKDYGSFSPNVDFNQTYGWISNYNLPVSVEYSDKDFIDDGTMLKVGGVTKGMGSPEPGEEHISTVYLPESRYLVDPKLSQEQQYYLNLKLFDNDPSETENEIEVSVPLTNINALFRNTRVIIDVNFNEGTDEIYVEIRSWYSTDNFYGTVSGGTSK